MTKTTILSHCYQCHYYTSYNFCAITSKDVVYDKIPDWCPLPDVEDNFICGMSVEECSKCGVECMEKEIKLLYK